MNTVLDANSIICFTPSGIYATVSEEIRITWCWHWELEIPLRLCYMMVSCYANFNTATIIIDSMDHHVLIRH